ncbi:MAG: right-handed parallel beta-helix repeat-containing protein [Myxococcales bacterium]|nr:right-handed parallel beta-helix repeat-containing protein [Myxococcales bacterium]
MRYAFGFLMALTVLAFAACGDNDGNCVEPVDVAGEWEMTTTDVIDSCGGRVPYTFPMTITQNGNALTAEFPGGPLTGTICGDQVRLSGSFPEDDGTATVSVALIVSADGDSMQGSDSWSWTDGFTDCSGSDSLSGTRTQEFPCTEQGIRDAIAQGGGPHTFACNGPTTVVTEAEIVIDNDVILDGEGNLTVDGNRSGDLDVDMGHVVFVVVEEVASELRRLTVTGGTCSGFCTEPWGIINSGTLTLTNVTVSGNSSGIDSYGTLTLINTTVSGNEGGGINSIGEPATATLTNSTVSSNGHSGIRNADGAMMTIANSTVSRNGEVGITNEAMMVIANSTFYGNGIGIDYSQLEGRALMVTNSLVADECNVDSSETISSGYNIESPGNTCGFDQDTDKTDVTPEELNLGELADNGGPTMTHKPGDGGFGDGSVAIDAIPGDSCEVTEDQRGMPRPETGGRMCDVGSVEVRP